MSDVSREALIEQAKAFRFPSAAGLHRQNAEYVPAGAAYAQVEARKLIDALLALVEQQEKAIREIADWPERPPGNPGGFVLPGDIARAALSGGSDE